MDYESDYRRQYCRERIARISDDYRRVQRPPRSNSEPRMRVAIAQIRSIVRARAPASSTAGSRVSAVMAEATAARL